MEQVLEQLSEIRPDAQLHGASATAACRLTEEGGRQHAADSLSDGAVEQVVDADAQFDRSGRVLAAATTATTATTKSPAAATTPATETAATALRFGIVIRRPAGSATERNNLGGVEVNGVESAGPRLSVSAKTEGPIVVTAVTVQVAASGDRIGTPGIVSERGD